MLLVVFCLSIFVRVVRGEESLEPPQNIQVRNWQLTWTPASEERGVTYTVQNSSFDSEKWTNVPACVRISYNSCDVSSLKTKENYSCVKLRVRAERGKEVSRRVEACSTHGDSCTPQYNVTARPGSLTVHLSKDHSLYHDHAAHVKYRVYYGKEGEPLTSKKDDVSSVVINGLQEGQRYCMTVLFTYHRDPIGLPSCTRCVLIPEAEKEPISTETVLAVVLPVVGIFVIGAPLMAYLVFFHCEQFKKWLVPPCRIPSEFLLVESFPANHRPVFSDLSEESCDRISGIISLS